MSMRWLVPSASASVRRLTSLIPCPATYSIAASSNFSRGPLPATSGKCTMWYMKPVAVTTTVPQPVEEVFDFLDVLANHEPFTDHMLRDWHYEGPARGVGARARVKATLGGRTETVEFEVV